MHGPQGRSKFRNLRRILIKEKWREERLSSSVGRVQGLGGGSKGFGSGGVGGRGTGPRDGANFDVSSAYKKQKNWFFAGCPVRGFTHRSWPGGQGGRPRALVAGEGWGGVGAGRFRGGRW